jgi:hypothetical protein
MKIGIFETNQIHIGDSRELSKNIPDDSIDRNLSVSKKVGR